MNWLFSFVVLQCTVLLVHCRPDSTGITPSIERVTLESQQTASVAAIIKSLENGTPLSSETRKHLAANVAFTEPLQSLQRHLPHGSPDINKNVEPTTPTKNRFDGEKLATPTATSTTTTTTTTVTATSSTTKKPVTAAKPIRYLHRLYRKRDARHISNANETQHTHLVDGQSQLHVGHDNNNNNNSLTNVVNASTHNQLRSLANQTDRQYLGNVYGINTYITKPLLATSTANQSIPWQLTAIVSTTQQPTIQAIFRPTTQSTTFYLTPNGVFHQTFNDSSPSPTIVNISNTLFKPIDAETYQLHRIPSIVPQYDDDDSSTLNILQHRQNITKLYSIIGTSTVHAYANVHEAQTSPTVTKNKILKQRVTTVSPNEPAHDDSSESQLTDLNILYDESYTTHTDDDSMHTEHNAIHVKTNATNILTNATEECSIDGSDSDSDCKTNDFKIIIKLNNGKKRIAHNGNNVRGKLKLRRVTTTTTTPTSYVEYEPYNYEEVDGNDDEEEDDEDYGFGSYVEPIQHVLGFEPAYQTRKKKPIHHKPMHTKPHKHDQDDTVNKYQTIILQTHAPPVHYTTEAPPILHTKHNKKFSLHSLMYKLLAFMPFLAIKPIFFGFWTMVLSPFVVIAVSGIALAVTLYPWITISQEQVAYASRLSSRRAPKIIVHRHPVRKIRGRSKMLRSRPHRPMTINRHARQPPFLRRRQLRLRRPARTLMQPFYEMREAFDNGRMLSLDRFPLRALQANMKRRRSKRRARDIHFQEWLLVQNNFNVRILSHNDHDNYL